MFFTVNTPIRIEGKAYRPCICYTATGDAMKLTVEKLVKEGKAEIHEKFVFFCNGRPVEQKAEKLETIEKPAKKSKVKKVEPEKFKEEVEEIVTPAECETEEGAEDF